MEEHPKEVTESVPLKQAKGVFDLIVSIRRIRASAVAASAFLIIVVLYEGFVGEGFLAFPRSVGEIFLGTDHNGFILSIFGVLVHFVVSDILAFLFDIVTGSMNILERIGVGFVVGLLIFLIGWFVILRFVSPELRTLSATVFATAHAVWGILLGTFLSRKESTT